MNYLTKRSYLHLLYCNCPIDCRSGASRSVVEEVLPDGLQFGSRGDRSCTITVCGLTYNYGVAEMLIKHVLLVRCG